MVSFTRWDLFYRNYRILRRVRPVEIEYIDGRAVIIAADREFDAIDDVFIPFPFLRRIK